MSNYLLDSSVMHADEFDVQALKNWKASVLRLPTILQDSKLITTIDARIEAIGTVMHADEFDVEKLKSKPIKGTLLFADPHAVAFPTLAKKRAPAPWRFIMPKQWKGPLT